MAKYTIELYKLFENENSFKLFDFDYKFYRDDLKLDFEKYFLDFFYFNEIGFETIGRFKKALQNRLNVIGDYYKEYYRTCEEVFTRNMMNTKEIKEEFIREVISNNQTNINHNDTNVSNGNSNNENIFSVTPKGKIENLEMYMTEGTLDKNNHNVTNENSGGSESESNNNLNEKTTFKSEGNLGVSSDGFLIEKWREVIVDINYKICNDELRDLFMLIY